LFWEIEINTNEGILKERIRQFSWLHKKALESQAS
jgi:PIN domain nuclease of toxin-antitoxin system